MEDMFTRAESLLGAAALSRLRAARVAVFGVGGVGGHVVEALARSGVGALELVDPDVVAPSNLNRQIVALHSTLGRYKADVAAARVLDINPDCRVTVRRIFFGPDTADQFDFTQYDYVADAIDSVPGKLALIERCKAAGTPIICAMGAGNKLDPTRFEVADIHQTSVCPLARTVRRLCRERGLRDVKVVYSQEPPRPPAPGNPPGSVAFVPAVAGMVMASEIVKAIGGGESGELR